MMSAEDQAKVKAWLDSHDEDERAGWVLVTRAFDEWLAEFKAEDVEERKEARDEVLRFARFRYNMPEGSAIPMWYAIFADGFLAGLDVAIKANEKGLREVISNDERAEA